MRLSTSSNSSSAECAYIIWILRIPNAKPEQHRKEQKSKRLQVLTFILLNENQKQQPTVNCVSVFFVRISRMSSRLNLIYLLFAFSSFRLDFCFWVLSFTFPYNVAIYVRHSNAYNHILHANSCCAQRKRDQIFDLRRILIARRFRATTIYIVIMSLWHKRCTLMSVNQVHLMIYSGFQLTATSNFGWQLNFSAASSRWR